MLVSNGLGFEGWIDRLAKAAPFKGRAIVASTGVATLAAGRPRPWSQPWPRARSALLAGCRRARGATSPTSPRAWPRPIRRTPRTIATVPQPTTARLVELDAWVKAEIAKVPAEQAPGDHRPRLVPLLLAAPTACSSSRRAATTPSSEPSAHDVAALIRQVREQKIKALFVENMTNPGLVDQIARESGAVVGPRLYSDALSRPGRPGADLRDDDAPQRDGAGRGDAEELSLLDREPPARS